MKQMTKKEFKQKLDILKEKNVQKEYRIRLEKEKNRYPKIRKIETSKLLAIYLFVLLNVIVIYAMIAMWKFADLSYLGVLITDIAAQILLYGIYCLKAYKAKKSEEDMNYKREFELNSLGKLLSAGADANEAVPVKGDVTTFVSNEDAVG